jgi:hypothetical protein
VIEAAILATRLHLTGVEPVLSEYERLRVTVEKTAGPREQEAFDLLWAYVSAGGHLPEEDADDPGGVNGCRPDHASPRAPIASWDQIAP